MSAGGRLRYLGAVALGVCAGVVAVPASAYSLWSDDTTEHGPGELHVERESGPLGELRIHNLLLAGPSGWLVPFNDHGSRVPETCAKLDAASAQPPLRINKNIDSCPSRLAAGEISMVVVNDGPHQGYQIATISPAGVLSMSADIVLKVGESAPVRASFYATTGAVALAPELHARAEEILRRMPWMKVAGAGLQGRLGDFNSNGWVDGTLVATGVLPNGAAKGGATPYLLIRHFETDLPVAGVLSGNVKALNTGQR